jgi:hypothetical protein
MIFKCKSICLVEIHRKIVEMYGAGAVNKGSVRFFKEGRTVYMMNEVVRQTIYVVSFQASCTVLTLQQVIITCFFTSNFWPPRV